MDELTQTPPEGDVLEIRKRGETCVNMTLRRTGAGLTLAVRANPRVEEFFRGVSTPDQINVKDVGRHWVSPTKDPLMAYQLAEGVPMLTTDKGHRVRFDRLAVPILQPGDRGGVNDINMGFLRLVGIGDHEIVFCLRGVFSEPNVAEIRDAIADGARRFYMSYIRPLNMNITIVSSEW